MPKSVLRAVLGRMHFTLHATRRTPHGASRLVQAMSAWLVKTRHAPSRHSTDARVYGHTTTTMHKLSTPPPRPLLDLPSFFVFSIRVMFVCPTHYFLFSFAVLYFLSVQPRRAVTEMMPMKRGLWLFFLFALSLPTPSFPFLG